jgi:hypothetical protein
VGFGNGLHPQIFFHFYLLEKLMGIIYDHSPVMDRIGPDLHIFPFIFSDLFYQNIG